MATQREELRKAQQLESIGMLAGGIAHDFNNLLTGIIGNISLLGLKVEKSGDLRERLGEVEKAADQAKDLTLQLLTFAKGGEPVKEVSNLTELIEESCRFCLRGSNVTYSIKSLQELWLVNVDRGQVHQVINNLVRNAKQAMEEGGTLEIEAENILVEQEDIRPVRPGSYVLVSIKDTGTGIAQKDILKVFDPYFTTKEAGSGLGLASPYSIIKRHNGHIGISSTVGIGTTLSIYLPALDEYSTAASKAEASIEPLTGEGKVLVVDDEEMIRDVAVAILEDMSYEVTTSTEGTAAVTLYKEAKESNRAFDVVLTDLTIPRGYGRQGGYTGTVGSTTLPQR